MSHSGSPRYFAVSIRDIYGVGHFVIPLDMFQFNLFTKLKGNKVSALFQGRPCQLKNASRVGR